MAKLSTITQKNQITIPSDIILDFKLKPSDKVLIEKQTNWIKITPMDEKSFLDLFGVIKTKKKLDFKKIRKQFEKEIANKSPKK